MRTNRARRSSLAALVALAAGLCAGCGPADATLTSGGRVPGAGVLVVLPLADAPGPESADSGKVICGAILQELVNLGKHSVTDVPQTKLRSALDQTGYAECDCYDPAVAAAVGKALGADLVVTGEVMDYGQHQDVTAVAVTYVSGSSTHTTYWVSLNVRIVSASDGKMLYVGHGTASSREGFASAALPAAKSAMEALCRQLGKGP